jgi:hypothetical protein
MVEYPVLRVNETPIHTNFTKKIAGNIAKVKPKGITFITAYPPIDHAIDSSCFTGDISCKILITMNMMDSFDELSL